MTFSPMRKRSERRVSSSESKNLFSTVGIGIERSSASAKPAGDVGLSLRVGGVHEDLRRLVVLDEFSEVEKRCAIRTARRLLHVVGDYDDGELRFQLMDQLLD